LTKQEFAKWRDRLIEVAKPRALIRNRGLDRHGHIQFFADVMEMKFDRAFAQFENSTDVDSQRV